MEIKYEKTDKSVFKTKCPNGVYFQGLVKVGSCRCRFKCVYFVRNNTDTQTVTCNHPEEK